MKKNDKMYIYSCFCIMAISGLGIYFLDNFFFIETEYGLRSNPWLDEFKLLHNSANFVFIFLVGKIFNQHIFLGLKKKKRDRFYSGHMIFYITLFLATSGVLLFYLSDEKLSGFLRDLHLYMGLFLIFNFLIYYLSLKNKKG